MSELTNSQCGNVNPRRRGTAGLLVDGSDEEIKEKVIALERRVDEALPGEPDCDLEETEEFRRLNCELALRGLPRVSEAPLPDPGQDDAETLRQRDLLALERRQWLGATLAGPQKRMVGQWRVLVTKGPVNCELIVPACVVVVDDADFYDAANRYEPRALEELLAFAEQLSELGVDVEATLGVSEQEIRRAYMVAAQREEAREAHHRMMAEKEQMERAKWAAGNAAKTVAVA
jgi:hypothetical protein